MKIKFSKRDENEESNSVTGYKSDKEIIRIAKEALSEIIDPELGIDIISLGLVYDIYLESTKVGSQKLSETTELETLVVDMTLTTPGCPVSESLPSQARDYLSEILGPQINVKMNIVWDPPWTPEKMDFTIARAMGLL